MTPELFDLLCAIGRADLTEPDRARVATLARDAGLADADADHPFLVEAASAGLLPLAYRHLIARGGAAGMSAPLAASLVSEFQRHAAGRFRPARRLGEILDELAAAGIDARAYKGPALAVELYGNFAMRQFSDLDVLVRPKDAQAASGCLERAGLAPASGPAWTALAAAHRRHEQSFVDRDTGTLVELHWALADRFDAIDVDVDWLMADAATIDLVGRPVLVMGPERTLLALAAHGSRHVWARLSWVVDLAEVIRAHPSLDWDVVLREARRIGFARALAASVWLAHDLVAAPPPSGLAEDRRIRRSGLAVRARLMKGREGDVDLFDRVEWNWAAADGLTRRAALLWRGATTPSLKDGASGGAWPASRWRLLWPRMRRIVRAVGAGRRARADRR